MDGTHCSQHDIFNRGCVGCLSAVRQYQAEQIRLDREANHNQEEDQGQDIFASVFEADDHGDEDGDGDLINDGFCILEVDLGN